MDEKLVNIILHRFLRFLKKKELYSTFCKNVHLNNKVHKDYYKTCIVTNIQIGNFMNIIGMAKYFTYEELIIYRALWCHYLINTPYISKLTPNLYKTLLDKVKILNHYHESTLLKYITDYSELDILRYCKMKR